MVPKIWTRLRVPVIQRTHTDIYSYYNRIKSRLFLVNTKNLVSETCGGETRVAIAQNPIAACMQIKSL